MKSGKKLSSLPPSSAPVSRRARFPVRSALCDCCNTPELASVWRRDRKRKSRDAAAEGVRAGVDDDHKNEIRHYSMWPLRQCLHRWLSPLKYLSGTLNLLKRSSFYYQVYGCRDLWPFSVEGRRFCGGHGAGFLLLSFSFIVHHSRHHKQMFSFIFTLLNINFHFPFVLFFLPLISVFFYL